MYKFILLLAFSNFILSMAYAKGVICMADRRANNGGFNQLEIRALPTGINEYEIRHSFIRSGKLENQVLIPKVECSISEQHPELFNCGLFGIETAAMTAQSTKLTRLTSIDSQELEESVEIHISSSPKRDGKLTLTFTAHECQAANE